MHRKESRGKWRKGKGRGGKDQLREERKKDGCSRRMTVLTRKAEALVVCSKAKSICLTDFLWSFE